MRKKVVVAIMLVMVMLSATACSDSNSHDNTENTVQTVSQTKSVDLKTVLSDINTQYADVTGTLRELSDVAELEKYYSVPTDAVKQFGAEISSDNNAPVEIVLIEANDENGAAQIKQKMDMRYNSILSMYASYSAEQLDTVKACQVEVNGNFVTMVVAPDYDGIMEIVNKAIAG